MKAEDKEILLKDIYARIPYGLVLYRKEDDCMLYLSDGYHIQADVIDNGYMPYLRPISSMTKEEKAELKAITNEFGDNWFEATTPEERWKCTFLNSSNEIDWLNAHHFDYRGLIDKDLALEAPEGIYNIKKK